MLQDVLKFAPHDQALLFDLATIETRLAYVAGIRHEEPERDKYNSNAKDYFVAALKGRVVLQTRTQQMRQLYDDFANIEFHGDERTARQQKVNYYQDILAAVGPTLRAFPHARGFAYIAADSSARIGFLLLSMPTPQNVPEAEMHLVNAIKMFETGGDLENQQVYNENFRTYCESYAKLAELRGAGGHVDAMMRDLSRMHEVCTPALNRYPWDFYLRAVFKQSADRAGSLLFEGMRYADALPKLTYASHWGMRDSSRLLARMYREGLGVKRDPEKAMEFETLAAKQTMRLFTVQANFATSSSPVTVYVVESPPEYPYLGIDDQIEWLRQARGATVDPRVAEQFRMWHKKARAANRSFPEAVEEALNQSASKTRE
jgi:hypothetical protein